MVDEKLDKQTADITDRYEQIMADVRAACKRSGRDPEEIKIIAVTKGQPAIKLAAALRAELRTFGESRPQEFVDKWGLFEDIGADIEWHFIGPLQENKVKQVVGRCSLIHSVHCNDLAKSISERAVSVGESTPVLLQVNVSGEETKLGVDADDAVDLANQMNEMKGIDFRGLMTMAPHEEDLQAVRPVFKTLAKLKEEIAKDIDQENLELSMGMTNDYAVAVEEGATMLRIGRALLGSRTQ